MIFNRDDIIIIIIIYIYNIHHYSITSETDNLKLGSKLALMKSGDAACCCCCWPIATAATATSTRGMRGATSVMTASTPFRAFGVLGIPRSTRVFRGHATRITSIGSGGSSVPARSDGHGHTIRFWLVFSVLLWRVPRGRLN